MTLHDLFLKHGSDKATHRYAPFYEQYLPKNPRKILEIGVKEGNSIRAWKEYFPEASIHGLDLFDEFPKPSIDGVKWWKGHQADYYILEQLRREEFDLCIDDGSHNSRDQLMTFFGLFTSGMSYFIEDIHCCEAGFYRDGLPRQSCIDFITFPDAYIHRDCQSPIVLIQC